MVSPFTPIVLIGNVEPQASAVAHYIDAVAELHWVYDERFMYKVWTAQPELIVVAGWRKLVGPDVLNRAPTVGFHSAKLPEYPGRAPVPWTLLRGDEFAYNTMLYLDEGVDSGDIIDERRMRLVAMDTPETIYKWMAHSAVSMLRKHLPALLAGTAPRTPQDMALRGPVTRADGWQRWAERCASSV